jgi:hypothetical protein
MTADLIIRQPGVSRECRGGFRTARPLKNYGYLPFLKGI